MKDIRKLWLGATLAAIALACGRPAAAQVRIVSVTGGRVEGVLVDGIVSFKGIPFAAPPIGELRWRAPQPVRPWNGIRKADHFTPGCMQAANLIQTFGVPPAIREDCLYLNVWTPARSARERLPVMAWIYGGSFVGGTTSQPAYDGTHLAQKGVVLVSLAYRVGVFGFLATSGLSAESPRDASGHYALLDMIAALKWVKANIAKFGGDPARVTIFGESAGGDAAGMLAQSPLARGLFQRAIAESGTAFGLDDDDFTTLRQAQQAGQHFLARLSATSVAESRALNARILLKAQGPALPTGSGFDTFSTGVPRGDAFPGDGYRLYQARRFNDTPVLIGSNSDEGSLFVPAHTAPSRFEAQIRALRPGCGRGAGGISACDRGGVHSGRSRHFPRYRDGMGSLDLGQVAVAGGSRACGLKPRLRSRPARPSSGSTPTRRLDGEFFSALKRSPVPTAPRTRRPTARLDCKSSCAQLYARPRYATSARATPSAPSSILRSAATFSAPRPAPRASHTSVCDAEATRCGTCTAASKLSSAPIPWWAALEASARSTSPRKPSRPAAP
jgi:acetyl esterase/lipase